MRSEERLYSNGMLKALTISLEVLRKDGVESPFNGRGGGRGKNWGVVEGE